MQTLSGNIGYTQDRDTRLVGSDGEAELPGIDDDEAVAAVGRIDGQCSQAFNFEPGIKLVGEGGHVADGNALRLAVPAIGRRLDQAAGRFENPRCPPVRAPGSGATPTTRTAPAALAATKQLLANVPNMTTDDAFAWTAPLSAELFKGDDAKEGMAAFLEKRPAAWIPPEHH